MSLQTLISEREARPMQAITSLNHSISFSTLSFPSELSLSFSYCNRQTDRMMQILPFHSRQSQTNTDTHTLGENKLSWKIMSLHSWCPDSKHILSSCSLPHSLAAQLQTYLSAKFVSPAQPSLVLLGSLLLRHQRLFLLGTPNNKQTAWEGRRKELWDHPWSNRLSEQTYSQFSDGLNSNCQIQSSTQISPKKTHTLGIQNADGLLVLRVTLTHWGSAESYGPPQRHQTVQPSLDDWQSWSLQAALGPEMKAHTS